MKANELKVTDLMVGNWVICYHPSRLKSFEKVSVGLLHTMQEQEYGHIKEDSPLFRIVEPIPLTPELLEKNGFVQDANYSFRFFSPKVYKARDIGVDFTIKGFTFWYGNTISIACGDGSRINRLPCFAHELQHALKLCGIDKEIVV